MTKTNTAKKWVLKNKVTGGIYPTFTYATRSAARKAANGRRFKGEYMPVKFMTTDTEVVYTPNKATLAAMKEATTFVQTETKTNFTRPVNRTPILRSNTGSTTFNTFPIHQRWM